MKPWEQDQWWIARQSHKPNRITEIAKSVIQSLPGQPAKTVYVVNRSLLGRADAGLIVDLNKYRTGRNLKAYVDAGVDAFSLRIGGPGAWVDGAWKYTEDPTYKPYLEQLDKLGMLGTTTGYIVHNPFEVMTENGATGETVHTELLDEWTSGGYMPQAFVYDHEINKCWTSIGKEILCTNVNLVKSLNINTDNTWKKFRRTVGIYTARWFINSTSLAEHSAWLDNVNRPEVGKQRPMWYAWYAQTYSKQYQNLEDSLTELLAPSTTQTASLLQCGSYSLADLWQFTYTLKLTGDDIGVDANVTLGSFADYCYAFGLTTAQPPVDPPDPPTPDLTALTARVEATEAGLAALVTWAKKFPGAL